MRNKILLTLLLVVISGSAIVGCGPKKPDGFPDVVPFKVKVVDGSTSIAGVDVFFIGEGNAVISGITDSTGVAEIRTKLSSSPYSAVGVPVGSYRVQCTKDPKVEHWKTPQEIAMMSIEEQGAYTQEYQEKCDALPREIPKFWSSFDKTPLTAEVASGGGEVTFDVEGKADEM